MNMKITTSFWLTALAAAMLSGCALPAVGPDYQVPELSLPSAWTVPLAGNATGAATGASQPSTAASAVMAQWWRQFNDPQLDQLIEEALAGSLDVKLAQARLRQARAGRDQAISGLFPTVTASGAATRSKTAEVITPTPVRTMYDAGFDAAWEIDIFGGTRRGIEATTADQQASEASLNHARVSLVAEVAQNYIELRAYQQRLEIARRNLASQTETLQITEWRNQAGLVGGSDVEQARTNREQTRAVIPDLEVSLSAAENRLAVLLGKNPGSLRQQLQAAKPLPDLPPSVASGIPSDVLRQRPDLIVAERTLAAETARVGQKLAKRFPSLKLGESFGWQAYSLGAIGAAGTLARTVTGTLAATLFDGGNLRSAVEIQNAVQEQALISYQKSVLLALEEVENGLKSYAVGRERVDARRGAAEAARNAAQLTRNLYQSGLADFQKVLETERTLLSAEDNLAVAEAGMRTSLVKLYKALGGGWESQSGAGGSQSRNDKS
ncbi:MAG: efflux system, outer rane lipoprotein, NodT [Burkholderiaceae bacterium]|nr:efflux system, outer rane lipoprotein, NodT [Burkholderiaceae bacterium]